MSADQPALWRIALTVPEAAAAAFADAIGDHAAAVATFEVEAGDSGEITEDTVQPGGIWLVEAVAQEEPDRARLAARVAVLAQALDLPEPELTIEPVPAIDWLTHSYQSFPPLSAGRFFIYGSHYEGTVPAARIGLLIDAATAFGTGEHGTTHGCLLALDRLARRTKIRKALDMGCGSGILALATARLWHIPVAAVDIDEEAVRVTRHNARRNRLGPWIRAQGGLGYRTGLARRGRPYDLITSNILARPLARMAPDLARHLTPGGIAVLSGLLHRHERWVLQAHRAQGLRLVARFPVGDWLTLVMKKARLLSGSQ